MEAIRPSLWERRSHDRFRVAVGVVAVVLVAVVIAYISLSDGVDYLHGFGGACLVMHNGWHVHVNCGKVYPPATR
jgi:hypothetical protein